MGNEIERDICPEKYYSISSVLKNCMPSVIAVMIVAFFSCSMIKENGSTFRKAIRTEIIFVLIMSSLIFLFFYSMTKHLKNIYISVCDNGVCGVCPVNGFKNKTFELSYNEITKISIKGDRMFLYSRADNVILTLKNPAETAALIRSKNPDILLSIK